MLLARTARSRQAVAMNRALSSSVASSSTSSVSIPEPNLTLPELPSSSLRSWETVYQQEKRVYNHQVHQLRKQYLHSHWQRMSEWYQIRLDEWNRLQKEKQIRGEQKRENAQQKRERAAERNKVMSQAYSAVRAQRTARRLNKEFKENVSRLALLAGMQATAHRWVGKENISQQISASLFDYRIPVPGLTPHRSEREEAMLAFFSSNERLSLPESVYATLGLAAEAAVLRAEQDALRAELGVDASAPKTMDEVEAQSDQAAAEKLAAIPDDGNVIAEKKDGDSAAPAADATASDATAAATPAGSAAGSKRSAKILSEVEQAAADAAKREAEADAERERLILREPNADMQLLAPRYQSKQPSLRQRFMASAMYPRGRSVFADGDLLGASSVSESEESIARQAIRRVGVSILDDEESRFESWYAYTRYLFAPASQQEELYAAFINQMLQRSGFKLQITVEDLRTIQEAQQESRADIDEALKAVSDAVQAKISTAGSVEKYAEKAAAEGAAGHADVVVQARIQEFEQLRQQALKDVQAERARLVAEEPDSAAAEQKEASEQDALAHLSASLQQDSSSNAAAAERAQAELNEAVTKQRAADALIANSTFASLFQELCLQRAKQESAAAAGNAAAGIETLSAEEAKRIKDEAVKSVVDRNRHAALKVKLETQRTLELSSQPEARAAFRAVESLQDRLQAERRQYQISQVQRAQQIQALRARASAGVPGAAAELQKLEQAQRAHRAAREREEGQAARMLQQISAQSVAHDSTSASADQQQRLASIKKDLLASRQAVMAEKRAADAAVRASNVSADFNLLGESEPEIVEQVEDASKSDAKAKVL